MPFADELLGLDAVHVLRDALAATGAPTSRLAAITASSMEQLTLRQRTDLLRDALLADLPADYPGFAAVVRAALPLGGWGVWPVTEAVAARALENAPEVSAAVFRDALELQAELTPGLTAEWGIRALLIYDLDAALAVISAWVTSPNEHVRRLASEGTRAYLPWGIRVPRLLPEAEKTLPILQALYRDESDYVRRSVANHVNDLARHRPDLVITLCRRWLAEPDAHTPALVRHALRTLIKSGDPEALALLGFAPAQLEVAEITLSASAITVGDSLGFSTTVKNLGSEPAQLAIDYVVHHRKANGSLTSKTFKLRTVSLEPGQSTAISKTHSFKEISTRRYHAGTHALGVQINGVAHPVAEFELGLS